MHPRPQPSTGAEAFSLMLEGSAEVRSWALPDLVDLPELVALTAAITFVAAPMPRPEFSASLRARLMESDPLALRSPERPVAETAAEVIDLATTRKRKATRRAYTAAAVGSLVLGTAGMAAAAQNSLPGSPLYSVKRAIEGAELSFAANDNARGHDLLDQASTRLTEVQQLATPPSASKTTLIQQALQAFSSSASEGTNLLFSSYQRNGNAGDLSEIQQFATTAAGQLNSLSPSVINQNRAQMLEASSLIANVEQQSKMLCPTCAALPPLTEQFKQLASASGGSGSLGALLAAPTHTFAAPTRTAAPVATASTSTHSTPSHSTTTHTTSKPTTAAPARPVTPTTNGLGPTLGAVLHPVLSTVSGVLQTTTNTVSGLLGALVPPQK